MRAKRGGCVAAITFACAYGGGHHSTAPDAAGLDDATADALPDKLSVVPSLTVGAGLFFSCALRPGGTAACWGYGDNGTIGNGSTADATHPTSVSNLSGAQALSVHGYTACVLAADRTVECWGNDFDGALGDGGVATSSSVPVQVPGVTDVVQVAIDDSQGCALHANTTVECWGGPGPSFPLANPPAIIPGLVGVVGMAPETAGHQCVVMDDGSVRCWGHDDSGELGDGRYGNGMMSSVPVTVSGLAAATAVTVSYDATCALLSDGTVRCWGDNSKGQLGDGSSAARSLAPVAVSNLSDVVAISAGDSYACATKSDGTAWCWGGNHDDGLGSMTMTTCPQGPCSTTPIQVTF